jgi:hypothetical protein
MSGFYEKCGDGAAILYVHEDQTNASSKTAAKKTSNSLNYLILVRAETSVMNRFFAAAFSNGHRSVEKALVRCL